jgi:hypothetical protein
VVARLLDGRVVKGRCLDLSPDKPVCHVLTADQGPVKVALADVKAVFFVKDLQGDPRYQEHRTPDPRDPRARGARVLEIRFADGEVLLGLAATYQPTRSFFFVIPVDPASNNVRVLVNRAAVTSVESRAAGG